MDIVTQGVLGAVMAQTAASRHTMRLAAAIGFFAGILADVDILISSPEDPLLNLEYHRHFTHSVFFIPFGGLVAAILAWPFARKHLDFRQVFIFSLLGYMLSGFLDASTSYGTHLFWPLLPQAVSFNIISIVDPIFTLSLLLTLVIAVKKRSHKVIAIGLSLAALYLVFGWLQMQTAREVSREIAAERGHPIERLLVKPTLGNLLLWRSVYQSDQRLHVDAIRLGVLSEHRIYAGDSVKLFNLSRDFPGLSPSSVLYRDIRRFMVFSDGYVAIRPQQPDFLVDVRYSMLPQSTRPLWGISLDRHHPQRHANFVVTRDNSVQTRHIFMTLLRGGDID